MNENTVVGNADIFLSYFFLLFLHFCLLSHFEIIKCIVKSLIATFVEIQLKKENLKSVFWAPEFGWYTGLIIVLYILLLGQPKKNCFQSVAG